MKIHLQRIRVILIGALLVSRSAFAASPSPAELLEKAIYAEETKGELAGAADLYRQVVNEAGANRALAAQAQVRLGLCELKLGNKGQAITELEQLRAEFPDKAKLLAILDQQMPSLLDEILKQIQDSYIQNVDRGELMETALRAIIGKLDAGSSILRPEDMAFISASELTELNAGIQQKIAGIGVALKASEITGDITVTTVLPGSPALKAGMGAGDQIVEVDDTPLPAGKELAMAVKLLRGPIGTPVSATVRRSGDLVKVRLVRDNIRLPSVTGDHYRADGTPEFMLDAPKKIGYVHLTQVGQESPDEILAALRELRAQGVRALVLDLRSNPGGLLAEAVTVSDAFLESGRILIVKGKAGEEIFDAKKDKDDFTGFPIAVVVNRKTASAAEVIAAALQDNHRAVIVGERTFGQALVKSIFPLKDGIGALKLPVAAYFRPTGANMNRYPGSKDSEDWGVKPDAGGEVPVSEAELNAYQEHRAQSATIGGPPASPFEDHQLQKALEYLAAQLADGKG